MVKPPSRYILKSSGTALRGLTGVNRLATPNLIPNARKCLYLATPVARPLRPNMRRYNSSRGKCTSGPLAPCCHNFASKAQKSTSKSYVAEVAASTQVIQPGTPQNPPERESMALGRWRRCYCARRPELGKNLWVPSPHHRASAPGLLAPCRLRPREV